jgi:uncharacterized membrane protein YdbT with pleckstrin-like domain
MSESTSNSSTHEEKPFTTTKAQNTHKEEEKSHAKEEKNQQSQEKSHSKSTNVFDQIDDFCTEYLSKQAPKLPQNIRDGFVQYLPMINMISIILGVLAAFFAIPTIFSAFVASSVVTSLGISYFGPFGFVGALITLAVYFVTVILQVLAHNGLALKKNQSWKYLVYGLYLYAAGSIVTFNFGGVVGSLIGLYFMYQVKGEYTK